MLVANCESVDSSALAEIMADYSSDDDGSFDYDTLDLTCASQELNAFIERISDNYKISY
jgi:hypothetical protein